tara:strand:+ start:276 stop:725 length:450 start_codon:yes stop_codon:yes gene_type:complete
MGITGRNLEKSTVALISKNTIMKGASGDELSFITSPRQACQVLEVGVTITKDHDTSLNGETIWECKVYDKNNESGVQIATATFAASSVAGDEKTTRDGSFAWVSAYENASDRIFAKGARIVMHMTQPSGDNGDIFAPYVIAIPNGAEPL